MPLRPGFRAPPELVPGATCRSPKSDRQNDVDFSTTWREQSADMSAFLLGWFRLIWLFTRGHQALVLENLALRQQLAVLIPECDTEEDVHEVLRELCEEIFVAQLAGWFRDEQTWPRDLGFDAFCRWFDFQHHSMLVDLSDEPLIDELDCLWLRVSCSSKNDAIYFWRTT